MSFSINNRRYTGCKTKLNPWIKSVINENCKNCDSFFDVFAGTGVVTGNFINDFHEFYINDFLYSNEAIYNAFFLNENYDERKLYAFLNKVNDLDATKIQENYVSINYGDKFFSKDDSKIIGEIRELIENEKFIFNKKEYSILLASLLYSCDKIANTCGHYEAYIKTKEIKNSFKYELIEPIIKNKNIDKNIKILRKDSNKIAGEIKSDIAYLDPPYSSRQYSRFYHVLETLTKWDKPKLYGSAMKPKEENMSDYCKSKAIDSFKSLVYSLDCKYIVVSYNNTYNSKSKSSKNKMSLDDIKRTLENRGETKIYSKDYKAFNAGKTDIDNHQEILFVTEVKND